MALTFTSARIINPANEKKRSMVRFLIDSGATYSVVPRENLKKLGIKPHSKKTFTLANGEIIERHLGDAVFEYSGERGASPVIFGEKGDSTLLGVVTLESLGLMLDPLRREIKPLPMLLGAIYESRVVSNYGA